MSSLGIAVAVVNDSVSNQQSERMSIDHTLRRGVVSGTGAESPRAVCGIGARRAADRVEPGPELAAARYIANYTYKSLSVFDRFVTRLLSKVLDKSYSARRMRAPILLGGGEEISPEAGMVVVELTCNSSRLFDEGVLRGHPRFAFRQNKRLAERRVRGG